MVLSVYAPLLRSAPRRALALALIGIGIGFGVEGTGADDMAKTPRPRNRLSARDGEPKVTQDASSNREQVADALRMLLILILLMR
jgi:hypothetical protein